MIGLLSFFWIASELQAWTAPWQTQSQAMSPWTHSEKKSRRESFFSALNEDAERSLSTERRNADDLESDESDSVNFVPAPRISKQRPAIKGEGEIKNLPWSAHRTMYPDAKFVSRLLWPVEGGRFTSGYGIRNGRFHEGIDISAPEGAGIRAAASGRVVFSGHLNGYGNVVVIYHGDGISSLYSHNSKNIKAKGAQVNKGDLIALVGKTGNAAGEHCHFETRRDGHPINPLRFTYSKSPFIARR